MKTAFFFTFVLLSACAATPIRHYQSLTAAIVANDLSATKAMAKEADVKGYLSQDNRKTYLMLAAEYADEKMVKFFLAKGVDPNAKSRARNTAIDYAVYAGKPENVRLLIEAGADVNAQNSQHNSVLHGAYLHRAEDKSGKIIPLLLQAGADPKQKNVWGQKPEEFGPLKKSGPNFFIYSNYCII